MQWFYLLLGLGRQVRRCYIIGFLGWLLYLLWHFGNEILLGGRCRLYWHLCIRLIWVLILCSLWWWCDVSVVVLLCRDWSHIHGVLRCTMSESNGSRIEAADVCLHGWDPAVFVVIALWCWESSGEFLCYGTHCVPPVLYWLCSSVVVWDRS